MSAALQSRKPTATDTDAFLLRIDAQLPAIRERATEVEQQGMISHEVIGWLTEADVFRAVQPRQWGGLELDLATFFEGAGRIASACASTGWVASVVGIHPWHIAMFDHWAQSDVWSANPNAMASTSYAPTGQARRVPGGFRLSGKWSYSSGVDHCEWVILGAVVPDDEPGGLGPEFRSFLVPRGDFTVDQESWHVTGLAGTGSKDVHVADWRGDGRPGIVHREQPGTRLGSGRPDGVASPGLHLRLAELLTEVEAARTRLAMTWQDFHARVTRGEEIPYVMRTRCRYDAAHALAHCAGAVYRLLEVNGGRTMNADEAFQRFFRDLLAMRNHIAATLEINASAYALAKLGAPPPPFIRSQRVVI